MSISFYKYDPVSPLSAPRLGTKTAAGWYCTRCKLTLCRGGEPAIHKPRPEWFDSCPQCEAERDDKAGPVKWIMSFTWDVPPGSVAGGILEQLAAAGAGHAVRAVAEDGDEGTLYTYEQFMSLVAECPIVFHNL